MSRIVNAVTAAACLGLLLASSGCAGRRGAGGATDLPATFEVVEWASGTQSGGGGGPGESCPVRLRDARDGTVLLLRRSENRSERTQEGNTTVTRYRAVGDYEVLTPGRYGLSASQWLRVDCVTRQPVGPVPRST
jgi:hypothetical protein